jgi:hypothetical protein
MVNWDGVGLRADSGHAGVAGRRPGKAQWSGDSGDSFAYGTRRVSQTSAVLSSLILVIGM